MATGDDDPPEADVEEGPVLAPEELDISGDEHVTEIDEGRFVVSPEARPADDPVAVESAPSAGRDDADAQSPAPSSTLTREVVYDWLSDDIHGASSRYGFDVTAKFDGEVGHRRLVSNDVVTIFESLVLWYAQQLDADTPVEDVLGILLAESNVPVRYPAGSIRRLLESTDVDAEDSVADLIAAVDEADGMEL